MGESAPRRLAWRLPLPLTAPALRGVPSGARAAVTLLAALVAGSPAVMPAAAQPTTTIIGAPADDAWHFEFTAALRARLDAATTPAPARAWARLEPLYPPPSALPRWLDAAGRPNADASEALALLAQAPAEGLDSRDYGVDSLAEGATGLAAAAAPDAAAAAAWDVELSLALLRYLHHLHAGRVDPRTLGFHVGARRDDDDLAARLAAALAARRLPALAAELAPPLAQYRSLRTALARYRALAALPFEPLPQPASTVRAGSAYGAAAALRHRLVAFGDLPSEQSPDTTGGVYDNSLADGVRRFQRRHGLAADGALGHATLAALNVPPAQRARQLELALERLRWLPPLAGQRWIAINIPTFRLWAWDGTTPGAAPPKSMSVIVGRALLTQTPVFLDEMPYLTFRPYWNVPASIVLNEILPALARDASYLVRHDMEIVRGGGDDARPVEASAANVALLRQGALRLRQRPGPNNSLGLVKFVFPNDANVYLHGTPAMRLFERSRRDFSHGCVRVEDPTGLAAWALREQPAWTRERIEAAMAGPRPLRVDLARPIRVMLFYVTAVADSGAIHFADDIYRHDVRLERALAAPSRP